MTSKQEELQQFNAAYSSIKHTQSTEQTRLASSEELLQTLVTGLASSSQSASGSSGGGYLGQLADSKKRMETATTDIEAIRIRLSMTLKTIKEKEDAYKTLVAKASGSHSAAEDLQLVVKKLQDQIQKLGWNGDLDKVHEEKLKNARVKVRQLSEVGFS